MHDQRDTSDAPAHISNLASVILDDDSRLITVKKIHKKFSLTFSIVANPLASGFDLRAGSVTVIVPSNVIPGQHQITRTFRHVYPRHDC